MKKAFKKAFLGYNKGQVKRKIMNLKKEHKRQMELLNEELQAQIDKNSELRNEIKKYKIPTWNTAEKQLVSELVQLKMNIDPSGRDSTLPEGK